MVTNTIAILCTKQHPRNMDFIRQIVSQYLLYLSQGKVNFQELMQWIGQRIQS